MAAFPVFCNRARIGHIFPGVQRTGKTKSSRKPPFFTGYLCPNRTQSPLLEWLRPPGLYAYAHTRPLARLAGSGYSRCAAAELVNAARIAAACGGRVFRPRGMPASWARRCAHNASCPVVFLPKKFASVCERGSPPSCKHPISLTPIGGGGVLRQIAQTDPFFLRSNTPLSVHNRPVLLCLFRLSVLYPVKNRL